MHDFAYHRPRDLAEAEAIYAAAGEARYLAGGQSLIPLLKHRLVRVEALIDLRDVLAGLAGIAKDGDRLVIGAGATHAAVADCSLIPALADLAASIGDVQVRNLGTLGGSLAHNDPAADYAAAALALAAEIRTSRRVLTAEDFLSGMFETALEPGEIVTAASFRVPDRAAYVKLRSPASRYAVVGVMVACFGTEVRAGVTGAAACAFRPVELEGALTRDFRPEAVDPLRWDAADMNDDMHADAAYRAHLVGVLAKRAVAAIH